MDWERKVQGFRSVPYRIAYSPATVEHLRCLKAHQRATVLDEVERQLTYQPAVRRRNRKPMRSNPVALWELRMGSLRVYYDVEQEPVPVVRIRAIGLKERNRVVIGREVVEL